MFILIVESKFVALTAKFSVFSLSGKSKDQIPCAVATLFVFISTFYLIGQPDHINKSIQNFCSRRSHIRVYWVKGVVEYSYVDNKRLTATDINEVMLHQEEIFFCSLVKFDLLL